MGKFTRSHSSKGVLPSPKTKILWLPLPEATRKTAFWYVFFLWGFTENTHYLLYTCTFGKREHPKGKADKVDNHQIRQHHLKNLNNCCKSITKILLNHKCKVSIWSTKRTMYKDNRPIFIERNVNNEGAHEWNS